MWADFEEKEYESAANIELSAGGLGPVWTPGQALEKLVGFDAAADPTADHVIWRILRAPRPPGLRLAPALWSPSARPRPERLATYPVSLVLQYKRPQYIRSPSAAQWSMWKRPYFRISRTSDQQRVLKRLERNLTGEAFVRYAAPAFASRGALDAAHLQGRVLRRSGFVSPGVLGYHRVWTYIRPGVEGRGNPGGKATVFEDLDAVLSRLSERPQDNLPVRTNLGEVLQAHVIRVGSAARERDPRVRRVVDRWMVTLQEPDHEVPTSLLPALEAYASIVAVTARIGATWVLRAA